MIDWQHKDVTKHTNTGPVFLKATALSHDDLIVLGEDPNDHDVHVILTADIWRILEDKDYPRLWWEAAGSPPP